MARGRFVVRFAVNRGEPVDQRERIRELPETTVLAESPRMLLVESDEQPLRELVESLPGCVLAPEQEIPVPDARERIEER